MCGTLSALFYHDGKQTRHQLAARFVSPAIFSMKSVSKVAHPHKLYVLQYRYVRHCRNVIRAFSFLRRLQSFKESLLSTTGHTTFIPADPACFIC